ncbi:MAG: rhomboid family intramembrane serine protease [Rhodocyclaceae bacterium]
MNEALNQHKSVIDGETFCNSINKLAPHGSGAALPDEEFFSSGNSEIGKARKWIWLAVALGSVGTVATSKGSLGSIGLTLLFAAILAALVNLMLRQQVVKSGPAVVISQDGIESRLLSGKTKKFPWKVIVGLAIERKQNMLVLQFQLDSSQGFPDKRNFWTGINYARPFIPLTSFDPTGQEALYQAVSRRVQITATGRDATTQINPLTEEREFRERLESFAPIPWATYGVIALNVIVWVATVALGAGVAGTSAEKLLLWGGNAASEVQRGEWWRLVTATFLHSGLVHVAVNMIGLAGAGVAVERIYGHRQFVLLYLGSGLIGSALSLHFSAQHAVSVGASGAVFGIAGALLVGMYQHRHQLPKTFGKQTLSSLGVFIAYSLVQGLAKQGIDNAAHVGGLLGGCALAFVLPKRFDMERFVRNLKGRTVVALVIATVATLTLTATAPQAAVDQKRVVEGQAAFILAIKELGAAMETIQKDLLNVQSGQMTERESDERSRTVLAPMMRQVTRDLSLAYLAPSDPRNPLLKESKRMSELLLEMFEMQSIYKEGSDKPEPIDPARMSAIEMEVKEVGQRLERITKETPNR